MSAFDTIRRLVRPLFASGPTLSDIMIERYGIPAEDVPRYRGDHYRIVASATYGGAAFWCLITATCTGLWHLTGTIIYMDVVSLLFFGGSALIAMAGHRMRNALRGGGQA